VTRTFDVKRGLVATLSIAMLAAVTLPSSAQAQAVTPSLQCVDLLPTPIEGNSGYQSVWLPWFGYDNIIEDTVIVDIGFTNAFSPLPIDRGQPTLFEPGVHEYAFTPGLLPTTADTLSWFLLGQPVVASLGSPKCRLTWRGEWSSEEAYGHLDLVRHGANAYVGNGDDTSSEPGTPDDDWDLLSQGVRARGAWDETSSYLTGDVVSRGGSSYLAAEPSTDADPTSSDVAWQLLAAKGDQGQPGSGTPGPDPITFPKSGGVSVTDGNVTASSTVILQYVGGAGKPTSVDEVHSGGFTASGSQGKSFTYVVYD
jgi:hypothetical protein